MPAKVIMAMLVALNLLTTCSQEPWEEYNDAGEGFYGFGIRVRGTCKKGFPWL